jgi:hypothetical protein
MGPFTMALAALAVDEVLADQQLAKWRAENTFHVPAVKHPLQFCVEGVTVTIRDDWKPAPISFAPLPTMAKLKPPTDWL